MQPALLVHFALVFPERRGWIWPKLALTYAIPAALLTLHIFIASGTLNFLPAVKHRYWLDKIELANLGTYFLVAAVIFLDELSPRAQRDSSAAIEVGHGRHLRRHRAVPVVLHRAVHFRHRSAIVDEGFGVFAGVDSALLRLRHHSLPLDGR